MATNTLCYEALPQMKFADLKKATKEKSQWRKATAVILLFDYKIGSKKTPVVLPLRRANQLKPLLKQIKADKHPNQKLAAGLLSTSKGEKGPKITFKMTHGGYQLDAVASKVGPLFQGWLKMEFEAEQGTEADAEAAEQTTPPTPNPSPQSEDSPETQKQRQATTDTLNAAKTVYKKSIAPIVKRFKEKANALMDADELRDALKAVDDFMNHYQNSDAELQKKLAPTYKKYQKDQQQLTKMAAHLDQIDIPPQSPEELDAALVRLQQELDQYTA